MAEGKREIFIKNGVRACDLSSLPRCQAIISSTGKSCKRPAKKGKTMCGIHLGTYHPGSKPNNRTALKSGFYSRAAMEERDRVRQVIRSIKQLREKLQDLAS